MKSQIWIAVSVYVLVAIIKKRLKLSATLYEMLQILSLTMFERMPLDQLLAQAMREDADHMSDKQLILFEYRWDATDQRYLFNKIVNGMAVKMDKSGRIVVPNPIRDRLGLKPDRELVHKHADGVLLQVPVPHPTMVHQGTTQTNYSGLRPLPPAGNAGR